MTFDSQNRTRFIELFDHLAPTIRGWSGCRHLELWQDVEYPNVMTTYSQWDDEAALNAYRRSEFFADSWARTKVLFAAAPETFSLMRARNVPDQPRMA